MARKWIVVHDGSVPGRAAMEMECLRCGTRYAPTLPLRTSMFLAMSRAFADDHRACEPGPAGRGA